MPSSPAIPAWLLATIAVLIVLSIVFYSRLLGRILQRGGQVSVREFGWPDLFLGSFFAFWFGLAVARGWNAPPHVLHDADVVRGAALFVVIMIGITGFLHFRGIKILPQFGLARVFPLKAPLLGLGLLLAAYPVVGCVGKLTELALGPQTQQQDVVRFFLEAMQKSDRTSLLLTLSLGILVAPVAEEFLFRGYLYGVMKRYCGPLAAMVLSAGLFAAVHLNLSSLPALFVLAVCFTIAYETTGSILVNMSMHALFNLTTFLVLFYLPHPAS